MTTPLIFFRISSLLNEIRGNCYYWQVSYISNNFPLFQEIFWYALVTFTLFFKYWINALQKLLCTIYGETDLAKKTITEFKCCSKFCFQNIFDITSYFLPVVWFCRCKNVEPLYLCSYCYFCCYLICLYLSRQLSVYNLKQRQEDS